MLGKCPTVLPFGKVFPHREMGSFLHFLRFFQRRIWQPIENIQFSYWIEAGTEILLLTKGFRGRAYDTCGARLHLQHGKAALDAAITQEAKNPVATPEAAF